ncbi:16S rRNA (cytidine(1402)-2'-O)-methyltransferase [Luteolibacter marinus]|uniref:16S rRNA (cytidine(1402)-2'-O)-methyltransferase n=1 Tax=Luteolibacter marinus TaxID=2776705 RepID=UPI001868500A|nr:16S rRNA (cytidine(1402)-2'-O)-methyltransferase [Luteolibacter marinus]
MVEDPAGGRFVLVPTPIGNMGDITLRAIEVLKEASRIACEDTRHSSPLLARLGISGKPLVSLHDHNEARRLPELLDAVRGGETVAVITDAGMPAVSDPGYRVVQACIEQELPFEVLPGPSAVLVALVGSGFPVHAFRFLGFLPIKKGKRLAILEDSLETEGTSIFFESPHRLLSTLELLAGKHPHAPCCVARELTKKFETYHRGSAAELLAHFQAHSPKGEIVFLVRSS